MTIALIDNGSLAPAAHEHLRGVAEALSRETGQPVEAVSWKHSDRIPPEKLGGKPAWTLHPWIERKREEGEQDFVVLPYFISPEGAIGSALRADLERIKSKQGLVERMAPMRFRVANGLGSSASGAMRSTLSEIVIARVRQTLGQTGLAPAHVIVVDHGGPSPASAAVREQVAAEVRAELSPAEASAVVAASMEMPDGPGFDFNRPLFAEALAACPRPDAVVAPLFLSPGRHAGPGGDLMQIASRAAPLRCQFTGLVGTHRLAHAALAATLVSFMSQ